MAREKKKKWPADPLRIKRFTYSLAVACRTLSNNGEIDFKALEEKLQSEQKAARKFPVEISKGNLRNWFFDKKDKPFVVVVPAQVFRNAINSIRPECGAWLTRSLNNSMMRFFCALDVFGSEISSTTRQIFEQENTICFHSIFTAIKNQWGPTRNYQSTHSISHPIIFALKTKLPVELPADVFVHSDPFTLLEFMLRSAQYTTDMSVEEFFDWTFDLAAMCLVIQANLDSLPREKVLDFGRAADYSALVLRSLFRRTSDFHEECEIYQLKADFNNAIQKPEKIAQMLTHAESILKREFLQLNSSVQFIDSIAPSISAMVEFWEAKAPKNKHELNEDFLNRFQPILDRDSNVDYEYSLRSKARVTTVTFVGIEQQSKKRKFLPVICEYDTSPRNRFAWGRYGATPRVLSISLLTHHYGHSNFGNFEVRRLLDNLISILPSSEIDGEVKITTQMISGILNYRPNQAV